MTTTYPVRVDGELDGLRASVSMLQGPAMATTF